MSTVVVYVHGLWQSGVESFWLRRLLAQDLGAEARAFSYPSVAANASTNARALAKHLTTIGADRLHLVGHSLGGLVILKLFEENADVHAQLPPGRIVLLGPPVRGSQTAQNLARLPFGRQIMGIGVGEELLEFHERRWSGVRDLGVIAGDQGLGLGRLVGSLTGASDGTVLVEETQLEGANDRVILRVSHTGMLFSSAVAHEAAAFLGTGRFSRHDPASAA